MKKFTETTHQRKRRTKGYVGTPAGKRTRSKQFRSGSKPKLRLLFAALAAIAVLTGCSSVSTQPDQNALHYQGGAIFPAAHTFVECISPNKQKYIGPGDSSYDYPAGQRTWKFDDHGDAGPIKVVSSDNVTMTVSGTLTFNLTGDCNLLRKFHEQIGIKHQPIMSGDKTAEGWVQLIGVYIDQPLRTTISNVAGGYKATELYNSSAVRQKFEDAVDQDLEAQVKNLAGEDYFTNFHVVVQKPDAPDAIVTALEASVAAQLNNQAQLQKNAAITTELQSIKQLVNELGPQGYIDYLAMKQCSDTKGAVCPYTFLPQGAIIQPKTK